MTTVAFKDLPLVELGTCQAWTVGSSDGTRAYMVLKNSEDQWACSCPATVVCKHIRRVQVALGRSDICVDCGRSLDICDNEERRCWQCFENHLAEQLGSKLRLVPRGAA